MDINDYSIKPCPFCGYHAKYIERKKMIGKVRCIVGIVCCDSAACGCRTMDIVVDGFGGGNNIKEDAIEIWNRRSK